MMVMPVPVSSCSIVLPALTTAAPEVVWRRVAGRWRAAIGRDLAGRVAVALRLRSPCRLPT